MHLPELLGELAGVLTDEMLWIEMLWIGVLFTSRSL